MSHGESWPGEPSDLSDLENEVEERADDDEAEPLEDDTGGDEDGEVELADDDEPSLRLAIHAESELDVPDDVDLLEGEPRGTRRGVGIVVSRSNAEITNLLLEAALAELEQIGVSRDQLVVMAVPGAFELPLGAMALGKTRRSPWNVALGGGS